MIKRTIAYLLISRPLYVLPAGAFALAGYLGSVGGSASSLTAILLFFGLTLLGMACWSANEITDCDSDRQGETKSKWGLYVSGGTGVLVSGQITARSAVFYVLLLSVAGIALVAALGTSVMIMSMLFFCIGLLYSIKPIRLKERGLVGLAAVAIAHGCLAFIAGWLAGGQRLTAEAMLFAAILSIAYFGFEGISHLIDHEQDRSNGEKTMSVVHGQERARALLAIAQCLPAAIITCAALLPVPLLPAVNLYLLLPVIGSAMLVAVATMLNREASSLYAMRIVSVPLLVAFAFLVI